MAFLRFLLWTACAVAFGVFLATWRTGGRTPVEHAQGAWERQAREGTWKDGAWKDGVRDTLRDAVPEGGVERVREGAAGAWARLKAAASALASPAAEARASPRPVAREEAPAWAPAEHHSPSDRRALQRLVGERAGKSDPSR
jgi:hypothetical protein